MKFLQRIRIMTILLACIILFSGIIGCSNSNTTDNKKPDESIITALPETTPVSESKTQVPEQSKEPDTEQENTDVKDDTYILPESDQRKYEYFELYNNYELFDVKQVAYARNEIFARKGHIFDDSLYQNYFEKRSWYNPVGKVSLEELNEIERYNAELLRFMEKGFEGSTSYVSEIEASEDSVGVICKLPAGLEYQTDLDGDGTMETVKWQKEMDSEAVVFVNQQSAHVSETNCGNWGEYAFIIDINSKDSYKEIVICDEGPSNDEWSYFYEYRNGKVALIGEASGYLEYGSLFCNKKSELVAFTRSNLLQTWFYAKRFKVDGNHKLKHIEEDFYLTAHPVFLKHSIQLAKDRSQKSQWFVAEDGQAALLSATDDNSWCRLTLEDGTEGWFMVKDFSTIVRDELSGSEVFDGLCYAD